MNSYNDFNTNFILMGRVYIVRGLLKGNVTQERCVHVCLNMKTYIYDGL